MADYYPLLKRAVSGLKDATPAAREAIYERARKALLGQLRAIEPPAAPEDIARESTELDAAIARVEADLAPAALLADAEKPTPVPLAPQPEPVRDAAAPSIPPSREEPIATPPSSSAEPVGPIANDAPAAAATADIAPEPVPSVEARLRAREPHRPMAPRPPRPRGQYRRVIILSAVAACVVALVAAAALRLRNSPDELARLKPTPAPTVETNAGGKIVERVGGDAGNSAATSTAPPVTSAPSAPSSSAVAPSFPVPAETPSSGAPVPDVSQSPIPVASRAALLVEAPDLEAKQRVYQGSVVWRLDNVPAGNGQPLGIAVHADADLPDAGLKVTLDIRKNSDPALPASNTIEVRFTLSASSPLRGISQIAVPQMRREESPNGDMLAGVPVKITDTYFLVGLTQGDLAARNADLMRTRGWLDIPIQLSDNRVAKLTLEKSAAGDRILGDALTTWSQ